MTRTLRGQSPRGSLGPGRSGGAGTDAGWHRARPRRPSTRSPRGPRGAATRSCALSRLPIAPPAPGYLLPRGGDPATPSPGVPAAALASRGLPPTVDLVRGGIVLVEAFGHVEPSHFRATFRLGLGSQQRGAEHGQGAEKRGQAEPGHGAGRGRRAPTSGAGGERRARGRGLASGARGRGSWSRSWRRAARGGGAGRKVELGLARQATVPGARRPAGGGGGGGGRGGGARPSGAEARGRWAPGSAGRRPGLSRPAAGQRRGEGGEGGRRRGGLGRRRALAALCSGCPAPVRSPGSARLTLPAAARLCPPQLRR